MKEFIQEHKWAVILSIIALIIVLLIYLIGWWTLLVGILIAVAIFFGRMIEGLLPQSVQRKTRMNHTLSREIAMKRLYAETVGGVDSIEDALEQSDSTALSEEDALFSDRLYEGVRAHTEEIDAEIETHATDWSIGRIAKVDLSILRIAVYEILYERSIPVGATVNEAVELAKEFGGEKSAGFVNGVLGAVIKAH